MDSPMFYFFIGVGVRITQPMTDRKIQQINRWISAVTIVSSYTAYGFMIYFIFFAPKSEYLATLINKVLNTKAIAAIAVSTVAKFLYTTLGLLNFDIKSFSINFPSFVANRDLCLLQSVCCCFITYSWSGLHVL